jgi:hypothetical protein
MTAPKMDDDEKMIAYNKTSWGDLMKIKMNGIVNNFVLN